MSRLSVRPRSYGGACANHGHATRPRVGLDGFSLRRIVRNVERVVKPVARIVAAPFLAPIAISAAAPLAIPRLLPRSTGGGSSPEIAYADPLGTPGAPITTPIIQGPIQQAPGFDVVPFGSTQPAPDYGPPVSLMTVPPTATPTGGLPAWVLPAALGAVVLVFTMRGHRR